MTNQLEEFVKLFHYSIQPQIFRPSVSNGVFGPDSFNIGYNALIFSGF